MPFALIVIGTVLLVAAARNTQGDLFDLVKGDFTGPNNFIYWFISIMIIGSLGYIPKLKPLSTAFLALVIVVLFLTRGKQGFFGKFTEAIGTTTEQKPAGDKVSLQFPQFAGFPSLSNTIQ
jgi:hypothetical protein